MHLGIPLAALSLLLLPAMVSAQAGSAADEKAIRDLESQWEAAWNRHDVPGMLRIFAPDVDVVNLSGAWFKGRDRFAASLNELHSGRAKESVWKMEEINVRFLTPEIALVHAYWNAHGERNPDGSPLPPRHGLNTLVEVKRDGQWIIVASHATEVAPSAAPSR